MDLTRTLYPTMCNIVKYLLSFKEEKKEEEERRKNEGSFGEWNSLFPWIRSRDGRMIESWIALTWLATSWYEEGIRVWRPEWDACKYVDPSVVSRTEPSAAIRLHDRWKMHPPSWNALAGTLGANQEKSLLVERGEKGRGKVEFHIDRFWRLKFKETT